VLPHGERLIDLTKKLQEGRYGCYNGGINTYLHTDEAGNKVLMTYPLFNVENPSTKTRALNVYDTHASMYDGIESTYRLNENNDMFITTSISDNDSDPHQYKGSTDGIGFKSIEAEAILMRPHAVSDGGVNTSKKGIGYDVANEQRQDGTAKRHNVGVSSNTFGAKTKYMAETGYFRTISWQNSNPEYLIPGMLVNLYRVKNGGVVKRRGILHASHTITDSQNKMRVTKLVIWSER
jgi:hypothetical protein